MNRHPAQYRIKFLQLQPFGRVFLIFGRNVTGHSRLTAFFMLGTFQNNLYPVSFFRHDLIILYRRYGVQIVILPVLRHLLYVALFDKFIDNSGNTVLIYRLYRGSRYFQGNPSVFFRNEEPLRLQIRVEFTFGLGV